MSVSFFFSRDQLTNNNKGVKKKIRAQQLRPRAGDVLSVIDDQFSISSRSDRELTRMGHNCLRSSVLPAAPLGTRLAPRQTTGGCSLVVSGNGRFLVRNRRK